MVTHTDQDLGYSVEIPKDWTVDLVDSEYICVQSESKDVFAIIQPRFVEDGVTGIELINDFLDGKHPFFDLGQAKDDRSLSLTRMIKVWKWYLCQWNLNTKNSCYNYSSNIIKTMNSGLFFGIAFTKDEFMLEKFRLMSIVNSFKMQGWQDPRTRDNNHVAQQSGDDDDEYPQTTQMTGYEEKTNRNENQQGPAQLQKLSLKRHVIYDPQFNMEVARCLIPEGWDCMKILYGIGTKHHPWHFPLLPSKALMRSCSFVFFQGNFTFRPTIICTIWSMVPPVAIK